jgi:hypothetical protein
MRFRCRKYVLTAETRRASVEGARPCARIPASQRSRSSTDASLTLPSRVVAREERSRRYASTVRGER